MKKYVFFMLFSTLLLQAAGDAGFDGNAFGSQLKSYFQNNQDLAINSVANGGVVTTLDGKQQGSAKLVCDQGQSGEFLNISYTGTSDINIQVKLDKNVDGKVDKIWNFDNVSGICSNGVIKCDKNTWNHCEYFQYSYGENINLVKTSLANVSNCYCINSSCGSIAAKDRNKVLGDIAAPIYSALSNNTQLVLSKAQLKGDALSYYGQNYSVCTNSGNNVYVDSSSDLQAMAKQMALKEKDDENSAYSAFYKGTDNNISPEDKAFQQQISSSVVNIGKSVQHTQSSQLDFSYTDSSSGKKVSANMQLTQDVEAKFCEVKVPKEDTTVFGDGSNRANATNSTTTYESDIRECTDNWTKCPVKEGESMKYDCGKISDMGEVLANLAVLNEASKDMTCSK